MSENAGGVPASVEASRVVSSAGVVRRVVPGVRSRKPGGVLGRIPRKTAGAESQLLDVLVGITLCSGSYTLAVEWKHVFAAVIHLRLVESL